MPHVGNRFARAERRLCSAQVERRFVAVTVSIQKAPRAARGRRGYGIEGQISGAAVNSQSRPPSAIGNGLVRRSLIRQRRPQGGRMRPAKPGHRGDVPCGVERQL